MPRRRRSLSIIFFFVFALPIVLSRSVTANEVNVAVAANFTAAAKQIGELFERSTGAKAIFSFGSTGQLFAQITHRAPFHVFLAADQARPEKAVADGHAVPGSRFTYATGRIVLYSADAALVTGEETLLNGRYTKIAIANPQTAPFGAAAVAAMKSLGVHDKLKDKIVSGTSIAQAFQFVATGSAELGFVAMSQVAETAAGSRWVVPASLYPVIAQDAVLLQNGKDNVAARAFLAFLRGPEAAAVKDRFGYGAGD